jgi:polyisoprenoid-binding protein YceI
LWLSGRGLAVSVNAMFSRMPALATLLAVFALAGCVTPSTDPQRLPAGAWELDPDHTSVVWSVRHMGLSWYTGRFDTLSASLDFDPARPEDAQLTAIINTASLSTGDADFDRDLSQDWLHATEVPQIVFTSRAIEVIDATHGRATGRLSLNGRDADAEMLIEFYGGSFNVLEGRNAIAFAGDMEIDRTVFAVGSLPASIVGDTVRIHIEAEFLRQGDTHD